MASRRGSLPWGRPTPRSASPTCCRPWQPRSRPDDPRHRRAGRPRGRGRRANGSPGAAGWTFAGNVRDHSRGRRVQYLEYDAYVPMAQRKLREIAEEAERRWDCRVAVHHRIGRLEIGEPSVLIAVSSAHRAVAFDACRYVIDTLKLTVPIWK